MPIDYKKYPPNWFSEIRPAVLERAGNCCEACKAPNHAIIYRPVKGSKQWKLAPEGHASDVMAQDGVKFVKIVLTIAHLDHDADNHDIKIERLRAWCQRCHLNYDRGRHMANRKYGISHSKNNLKLF